jgi:hypothetical protein
MGHMEFLDLACHGNYRDEATQIFLDPVIVRLREAAEDTDFPFCQEYINVLRNLAPVIVFDFYDNDMSVRQLFRMQWRGHFGLYFEWAAQGRRGSLSRHIAQAFTSDGMDEFFENMETLFDGDLHMYLVAYTLWLTGVGIFNFLDANYPAEHRDAQIRMFRNYCPEGQWRLEGFIG